jgi:hypothetical protein
MKNLFIQIVARVQGHIKTTFLGFVLLLVGFVGVYIGKATFSEFVTSWPVVIALLLSKDDLINKIIGK